MNVDFCDKITQTVFHNTANLPQNREFFQNWIARKILGAYCDRGETDFPDGPQGDAHGTVGTLHIVLPVRHIIRAGDTAYEWYGSYFDWWLSEIKVDKFGFPAANAKPHTFLVGGLCNHGTLEQPDWGSHT